jgi:hypothetical protein
VSGCGYSRGAATLIPDRLLFRPDIPPVGIGPCEGYALSPVADDSG